MATFPVYTEDQCFELAIAYLSEKYPTKATHEKSFLGQLARALAQLVGALQEKLKAAADDAIPALQVDLAGTIRSRCSRQALDSWAFVFGLESNRGAGVYGRNGSQPATGGAGTPTGTAGVFVPGGSTLTDPTGTVVVAVASAFTLPVLGPVTFNALTPGAVSNLPVGTKLRWQSPPLGLAAEVTLSTALRNGLDEETDLELLLRLLRRLQLPPKGGTAADYRAWSEASLDVAGSSLGITRAYVYPLKDGTGSVSVVITQAGSGTSRDPGSVKAAQVQAYLDKLRIATDTVYVLRPSFPAGQKLGITAFVVTQPGYQFDWLYTGAQTVVSYTGTSLVINGAEPTAGLKAAIDNGAKPRLQLALPAYSALPQQVRVLSYAANTPTAGQCTLTLEAALPASPSAADALYPGGGAVAPVAAALLAYVDSIGPSNQSGFADPLDDWESLVSISRMAQAALNARTAENLPALVYSPKVGLGIGLTIKVGAGPTAADDVPLFDNVPGQGPQLPEVAFILVRPA